MAQIILNVPDGVLQQVIDVMAASGGWTPEQGPKASFAKGVLIEGIMATLRSTYGNQAAEAARAQAIADVDRLVKIT